MNKKWILLSVLSATALATVAGCGSNDETPATTATTSAAASTSDVSLQTKENLAAVAIGAATNSTPVTITIPQSMTHTIEQPQALAVANNYQSVISNPDGSYTITITTDQQATMLARISQSVDSTFEAFVGGAYTPYITNITHDQDFKTVTVSVDKQMYDQSIVDLSSELIGPYAAFYQAYQGVSPQVTITIQDNLTSMALDTKSYPAANASTTTSATSTATGTTATDTTASGSSATGSSATSASGSSAEAAPTATPDDGKTLTERNLQQIDKRTLVLTEDADLYSDADRESSVVSKITKGTTFESTEATNYYYKTTIDGETGYIRKQLATVQ